MTEKGEQEERRVGPQGGWWSGGCSSGAYLGQVRPTQEDEDQDQSLRGILTGRNFTEGKILLLLPFIPSSSPHGGQTLRP